MTLRRMRQSKVIRDVFRETIVRPQNLMQPLFVVDGIRESEAVAGLPGVTRETPAGLLKQIENDLEMGVKSFLLFGVPAEKSSAQFSYEFTANAIQAAKQRFGNEIFLAVDVCLCSYTDHGHCGILDAGQSKVENVASVEALTKAALTYAQAGADCVAPSDMMDGRIGSIRSALENAGKDQTILMSYAAKFHSKFYGPFRNAADSAPNIEALKDRASYQIDPANPGDAIRSVYRDIDEGADIIMVKPGMPYLDILKTLRDSLEGMPLAVYQVSGESAAIHALAEKGLIDKDQALLETWISFKRAGANLIIAYDARRAREICHLQ